MSENKTKPSQKSVKAFLNSIEPETKRKDAWGLHEIIQKITGEEPILWGDSIVGYGSYHYKYASGREGDWMKVGFSPRKQNFSLYLLPGIEKFQELLSKLGKHKTGKSCLYINKLADVDQEILQRLISESYRHFKEN